MVKYQRLKLAEREGISLGQDVLWEVSSGKDLPSFLRGLIDLVPSESILYLEGGTPTKEIELYLEERRANKITKVALGTIWPRPKCFHIPISSENIEGLAKLTEKIAVPEAAIHLHVYKEDKVLLDMKSHLAIAIKSAKWFWGAVLFYFFIMGGLMYDIDLEPDATKRLLIIITSLPCIFYAVFISGFSILGKLYNLPWFKWASYAVAGGSCLPIMMMVKESDLRSNTTLLMSPVTWYSMAFMVFGYGILKLKPYQGRSAGLGGWTIMLVGFFSLLISSQPLYRR